VREMRRPWCKDEFVKKQCKKLVLSEIAEKQWVISMKYLVENTLIYKQKNLAKVNSLLVSCFPKKKNLLQWKCAVRQTQTEIAFTHPLF